MKQRVLLVPAVTTWEALKHCVARRSTIFAIEKPLYSEILSALDQADFLAGYCVELYSDQKIIIAKRNRFPHRFREKRVRLIYPPLNWL